MTVEELMAKLSTYPPGAELTLWCNYMQDAAITVHLPDGDEDIWEV